MAPPKRFRSLSDQQLVEQALQGDQSAFGELVRRYREDIFFQVLKMVDDWDVADSLSHETFARAYRALIRYKPEYKFSAWLAKIAKNAALDRLGKNKKKIAKLAIEGSSMMDTDQVRRNAPLQVPAREHDPMQKVLFTERQREILRAVAGLRPEYRDAVLLSVKGLSYAEIAKKMKVPVGTVGTYVSRAREELRKALGMPPDEGAL
jgi:RNA polymerase sigma-70 factor, ECF subfamily